MNTTNGVHDDTLGGHSLQDRITARLATMTRAERKVAEYLRSNSRYAIFATAEQIASAAGTSDAGLLELRQSLTQQVVRATSPSVEPRHQAGPDGNSATAAILAQVFTEATERLANTWRLTTEPLFDAAVEVLAEAEEVVAFGIGPSEMVAQYLALRLRRIGHRARSTGATGFRLADDLLGIGAGDVVVLFSPSRLLAEIEVVLDHAETVGAKAVLISDTLGAVFADRVHVALSSTHTSSGFTAQVLTDALVLAVRARNEAQATDRAELLTALRSELSPTGSRGHKSRRTRPSPPEKESP
jgi:DNA-binding MurR/RpiR family transcriptional regulator